MSEEQQPPVVQDLDIPRRTFMPTLEPDTGAVAAAARDLAEKPIDFQGELPTPDEVQSRMAELEALGERAKRIFATARWAGVVAVTEMSDGYEAAMEVVRAGPQQFLPDPEEWGPERLSESARVAIEYIETGQTP
jgi:hypothetical protein